MYNTTYVDLNREVIDKCNAVDYWVKKSEINPDKYMTYSELLSMIGIIARALHIKREVIFQALLTLKLSNNE